MDARHGNSAREATRDGLLAPGLTERAREQLERPFSQRLIVLRALTPVLLALAAVYALIMRLRRSLAVLQGHIASREVVDAEHKHRPRVIAVGNISLGGTGKSPLVRHLAFEAIYRGFRVCVLSRGYRSKSGWHTPGGDGDASAAEALSAAFPHLRATELSDESAELCLFAKSHLSPAERSRLLVLQCPDRRGALRGLVRVPGFRPSDDGSLVLLDDGLQHVWCPRDVEICIWSDPGLSADCAAPPFCLPAGPYREGFGSMDFARLRARSSFNVWSGGREGVGVLGAPAGPSRWGKRPYRLELRPFFARVRRGRGEPDDASGAGLVLEPVDPHPSPARALVITGIARPQRFLCTLRSCLPSLAAEGSVVHVALDDHAPFVSLFRSKVGKASIPAECETLILTGKDWARFQLEPVFRQFIKDRETFVCLTDPVVKSLEDAHNEPFVAQVFEHLGLGAERRKV